MFRRIVAFWLILAMLFGACVILDTTVDFFSPARGETLYVNATGGNGIYTSIQDAIDSADAGDTVFVYSGRYSGDIHLNKTVNLMGQDRNTTIIEGTGEGEVVNITADWVSISCFTITGMGSGPKDRAIKLSKGKNCSITRVKIYKGAISFGTPLDIDQLLSFDTIIYTIFSGRCPLLYNANKHFNRSIMISEQGSINYDYRLSNYDTIHIQVNEIHVQPVITITLPNSSYFNVTPITSPYVNFTITPAPVIESPITTVNIVNISNASDYFVYNNPGMNWTYPGENYPIFLIPISARVNLTASAGDGYVLLHWRTLPFYNGPPIQSYNIYRSAAGGPEILIAEVGNITESYRDEDVENGITYRYTVRIYTEWGRGPPSNEVSARPHHDYSFYDIMTVKYAGLIWWLWIIISVSGTLIFIVVVNRFFDRRR